MLRHAAQRSIRNAMLMLGIGAGAGVSACGGGDDSAAAASTAAPATTTPTPTPAPTVSLEASSGSIAAGASSTLTWASANATACTASGGWSGGEATSGSRTETPAGTTTYTLTCSGSGGSAQASATVTVTATAPAAPGVALTPPTLTFASQTTGTTSAAQAITVSNTGGAALSGIVLAMSGDFAETSTCGTTLAAKASCTISVTFTPTAAGARGGALTLSSNAANGTVSVALNGTGSAATPASAALPLLSVGLPIYASSAATPASDANAGNYTETWRSVGVPVTLSLDLSSVPAAQRSSIWLVWYNDATYGYDHALIGQQGYNNPGAYTLAVNAAPGGTPPPATGWTPVASLANNTLHSYSQNIPFAGYNWIQYQFTASDGSPQNSDIALDLDVYGTSNGITDGWFFNGDSITANCMQHDAVDAQDENDPSTYISIATPSFGQQVNALVGNDTPEQENAGMPGYTAAEMIPHLAGWLRNVPSIYVTLSLGTNDAVSGITPAQFYGNMASLVQAVIAAGKVPIVPTIPYSLDAAHQATIPGLNAQLQALYKAVPAIVPGPDLYTYFLNNPQYLSTDKIHPNAQGCVAYRTLWAKFAAGTIYGQ